MNIVPGDFNGDSVMDLLITSQMPNDASKYKMSLFLGEKSARYSNQLGAELVIDLTIVDQPFAAE